MSYNVTDAHPLAGPEPAGASAAFLGLSFLSFLAKSFTSRGLMPRSEVLFALAAPAVIVGGSASREGGKSWGEED